MSSYDDITEGLKKIHDSVYVSGTKRTSSYKSGHTNDGEYPRVKTYLDGGAVPSPWPTTLMGQGLSLVERGRRTLPVTPPDPPDPPDPPPPPTGTSYMTLASLSRVFGKWYTAPGSGAQEALSTAPPHTPWSSIAPSASITEISTPYGDGMRFVCNSEMEASWDADAKLSYAARDRDWEFLGLTEEWTFHFMLPTSGNPQGVPNTWAVNAMWELGHTSNASGHHIALDMQTGQVRCRVGRQTAPGNSYNYAYSAALAMDVWHSVLVRCKFSLGSDGSFFCSINGATLHDSGGATMWDSGGWPGVMQWGWYGQRMLDNEIRFAALQRVMA